LGDQSPPVPTVVAIITTDVESRLGTCLSLTFLRLSGVVTFSVASVLCVRLSVCNALTFESFGPESSFLVSKYIFGISRSSSPIKVKITRAKCVFVNCDPVCGWSAFD